MAEREPSLWVILVSRSKKPPVKARVVNVTAYSVVVRHSGKEIVFSRRTGLARTDTDLELSRSDMAYYAPQNKRAMTDRTRGLGG